MTEPKAFPALARVLEDVEGWLAFGMVKRDAGYIEQAHTELEKARELLASMEGTSLDRITKAIAACRSEK
jgi:hypothetical protein